MHALFAGRWIILDVKKWYCMTLGVTADNTLEDLQRNKYLGCDIETFEKGAILHWNGPVKPWDPKYTVNERFRKVWRPFHVEKCTSR